MIHERKKIKEEKNVKDKEYKFSINCEILNYMNFLFLVIVKSNKETSENEKWWTTILKIKLHRKYFNFELILNLWNNLLIMKNVLFLVHEKLYTTSEEWS